MTYYNIKTNHGIETVDELDPKDFASRREFLKERKRLRKEYWVAGIEVYTSARPTRDWREK